MQIKLYEGFRYQLTKYQLYLLNQILSLDKELKGKQEETEKLWTEFMDFYSKNSLDKDPNEYVNYLKIVEYTPPLVVYDYENILNIPDMLKESFRNEFRFCFCTLNTDILLNYHPNVRFEIINDLYDAIYIDMYNTYYRVIGYKKKRYIAHKMIYSDKLQYILSNYDSYLYNKILEERKKIFDILDGVNKYKINTENELFLLNKQYYDVMSKVYENETSLIDLIEYNKLFATESFFKGFDSVENLLVKTMNIYITLNNYLKDQDARFWKIDRRFKIVRGFVEELLNE